MEKNMITSIITVVTILLSTLILSTSRIVPPFPDTHVTMVNQLGPGIGMNTHCKSADDDLGLHYRAPNDAYEFSFKPNIIGGTLFFCSVSWTNSAGEDELRQIDIYDQGRDDKVCFSNCCWNIVDLGICSCDTLNCIRWKNT